MKHVHAACQLHDRKVPVLASNDHNALKHTDLRPRHDPWNIGVPLSGWELHLDAKGCQYIEDEPDLTSLRYQR